MDIYASDEEKGEEIKRWWRENGLSVMIGIALGIAALFGGRYWLTQQAMNVSSASSLYQQANVYLAEGRAAEAASSVDLLFSDYAATPYATFAALDMAKNSLENQDVNGAKAYLEWVIGNAKLVGQQEIARLRLSQLQLKEENYVDAMATANQGGTLAFKSLFDELKGDIYIAQGKMSEAAVAYQSAKAALEQNEPRGLILKLKLDDIAGSE
ncbi:MAG: tetratricopeptide repeat protein [Piscirickettsiaceae bacterium]|nr:tetratricopeptide repeat protein [Piscirickettsiaceae bacterium]